MEEYQNPSTANHKHIAWNKGKLIGPKPPLSPKHVWSIRTKLQDLEDADEVYVHLERTFARIADGVRERPEAHSGGEIRQRHTRLKLEFSWKRERHSGVIVN